MVRRRALHLRADLLLLAVIAHGLGACLSGASDPTVVTLSVALGGHGSAKGRAVRPGEVVDLALAPCFVQASVSAADLVAPARAAYACDPDEPLPAELTLELEVAPGAARTLAAVVFIADASGLATFVGDATGLELLPGDAVLELELAAAPVGVVEGLIVGAPADCAGLVAIDSATGVRLPAVPVTTSGTALRFERPDLPRGRFFQVELVRDTAAPLRLPDCTIYAIPGTVRSVTLDVDAGSC